MFTAVFSRFYNALQAQRERWVFWLPVPMASGIAFYFSLSFEPWGGLGAVFSVLFLGLAVALRHRPWFLPVLAVFLFALGFAAAQWRTARVEAPVLMRETAPLTLQGRVVELDPLPGADRVLIDQVQVTEAKRLPGAVPKKIRLRLKKSGQGLPRAGDIVSVRAVLLPLSPPVAPGAFDFQRYAFFNGIGATGYAIGDMTVVTPSTRGFFFEHLRQAMRQKIEAVILDHDTAAVTTALLIGESNNITKDTWQAVRISGIAHIISISGFHISLLVGFSFFILRALLAAVPYIALNWPVKKITAGFCIFIAIAYLLLIGSPVPALRSVLMAVVVMLAVMLDRDPFTQRLTAFSAICVFFLAPDALTGPSFQLSYAAVIALIAAFESGRPFLSASIDRDQPWLLRLPRIVALAIAVSILTTMIASLATAPYALYHFGRMPTWAGVAANAVSVPLSSFIIMPFGFLACLLMPFGLEKIPLMITGTGVDWMLDVAREVSAWPYAQVTSPSWPLASLVCMALGGLWICFWRGRLRWLGLVLIAPALAFGLGQKRPDILISADGDLVALRSQPDVLRLSSLRKERFVREKWMEREGIDTALPWPEDGAPAEDGIACDTAACRWTGVDAKASFMRKAEAFLEECAEVDLIVTQAYQPKDLTACKYGFTAIDRKFLRYSGPVAVYFDPRGIRLETVADDRGHRPWTGWIGKSSVQKERPALTQEW